MLYALIIACEFGFWLVLLLGLACRYLLRKERLSRACLLSLPVIDLALLLFTGLDLRQGAPATFAHGLAAAYIGFTLAFGAPAVQWADAHFAHRFAGGPVPPKAPTRGWPAVRHELLIWARCIAACVITLVLVELLVQFVGAGADPLPLLAWQKHAFGCVVIWFFFGPVWALATAWRRAP